MPITDYKVTDIERDAVRMQGKADPLAGTLAQNQAEFDEYPELVRDNLDGLCDYLATAPISYASSAAAATTLKGTLAGFVPLGGVVEIAMINGNTAAAPTLTIDGVPHTITGMPTVAQVQANSTQTYRFIKTGATALTFTSTPDYICESGTVTNGFTYKRYASRKYECYIRKNIGSLALSNMLVTGVYYAFASIGVNFPANFVTILYTDTSLESCANGVVFKAVESPAVSVSTPCSIVLTKFNSDANFTGTNIILNNKTIGTW